MKRYIRFVLPAVLLALGAAAFLVATPQISAKTTVSVEPASNELALLAGGAFAVTSQNCENPCITEPGSCDFIGVTPYPCGTPGSNCYCWYCAGDWGCWHRSQLH